MSFWSNVKDTAAAFGRWMLADETTPYGTYPVVPSRTAATTVTVERALSLSTFYRGVQIHATAVCQLPLITERNGEPTNETHPLVQKPNIDMSRSAFLEYTTVSLYVDGNAFWRIVRNALDQVVNLEPLNPNEVTVNVERDDNGRETVWYGWRGKRLTTKDIKHLQL